MSETASEILARQAAAYVTGRPDYPAEIVGWLRNELNLGEGKIAVDLGSGTGKFLPRLKETGARIIAIEPLAEMRRHLVAHHPDIEAIEGRAQSIPLPDASADAVICAQCFHLFASSEALSEIRRVLKPGGALGLTWNIRDAAEPWVARIVEIMAPYEHGVSSAPHYESGAWKAAFPAEGFSDLCEMQFDNPQMGSPETIILDRALSTHSIAKLSSKDRDAVIARMREVISTTPKLAGRQTVTFPNLCYAYSCRKTG